MRLTALFCLCGAVAGLAAGVLWMPRYTATATLAFVDRAAEPGTFARRRTEFFTAVRSEVISERPSADIRMNDIHGCTIRSTSSDRREAQRMTNEIVTRFIAISLRRDADPGSLAPSRQAILNRLDRLEARTAALEGIPSYMGEASDRTSLGAATVGVELLDPPTVPQGWEYRRALLLAGGALAGLGMAVVISRPTPGRSPAAKLKL